MPRYKVTYYVPKFEKQDSIYLYTSAKDIIKEAQFILDALLNWYIHTPGGHIHYGKYDYKITNIEERR